MPCPTIIALAAVPLAVPVYRGLRANYESPYQLMPAMAKNVQLHMAAGLLLVVGYVIAIIADHNMASPPFFLQLMEYRTLGTTGVRVSALCLGAMMFGAWGNTDEDECVRMIHARPRRGDQLHRHRRRVLGGASPRRSSAGRCKGRRDDVVLATKVHGQMGEGANERGNSRLWIMREVEDSLRRLRTDHIDLYQIHRPDPDTDIEETLGALTDLVEQGKIRYFGSLDVPRVADRRGPVGGERRGLERASRASSRRTRSSSGRSRPDVLPVVPAATAWASSCGARWPAGGSPGKYRRGEEPPEGSRMRRYAGRERRTGAAGSSSTRPGNQRKLDLVEDLAAVGRRRPAISLTHMAIAFTLAHPAVTSAIIGPRTPEQLEDLLAGADVGWTATTLDAIDEVVEPGETVEEADRGWAPPWMEPAARRR